MTNFSLHCFAATSNVIIMKNVNRETNIQTEDFFGVKIITAPTKVRYSENEYLDPSGLSIEINNGYGTEYVQYSEYNSYEWTFIPHIATGLTVNDTEVYATYKGYNFSFKIIVTQNENNYLMNTDTSVGLVSKGIIYHGKFTESVSATANTQNLQYIPQVPMVSMEQAMQNAIRQQAIRIGNYIIEKDGTIKDIYGYTMGSIGRGDRVNVDGTFIYADGTVIHPNGMIEYSNGNQYSDSRNIDNYDGSVTTSNGLTYFKNGDIMDANKTTFHIDGTVTYANGDKLDINGILHYTDGSIRLTDGTIYKVDGTIHYPNGTIIDKEGQLLNTGAIYETKGTWEYNPKLNKWRFVNRENGTIKIYKDQWIYAKNPQGELIWYKVNEDGDMVTGWVRYKNKVYYMSKDSGTLGELQKGLKRIDGREYLFDENTGELKQGSVPISILK